MAPSVVQNLEGSQNTGLATVTVSHSATTANNLLILVVGADDYRTTSGSSRPESSSYTLPTGAGQETFLGHYVWYKVAAGGETSVQYTIGSASTSCWEFYEISGLEVSPYDTSNGQFAQSSATSYTTPTITPSAGDRWLFASIGGSLSSAFTGVDTWLSSFVELNDTFTTLGSGTRDLVSGASLQVTANGSTGYSSGASYTGAVTPQSRTGIILSFKVAASGTSASATEATATGTAQTPTASAGANAPEATGTGTAYGPTVAVTYSPTEATATGDAQTPAASAGAAAAEATGAGTAFGPSVAVTCSPTEAVGAGTAYGATVSFDVVVTAGVATGAGSAQTPLSGQVLFSTQTPAVPDGDDGVPAIITATSLTFGHAGTITAVRFLATTTPGGVYTGAVWQVDTNDATGAGTGTLLTSEVLAVAPHSGEWTAIPLSSPVAVSAGVLYRIGVHNSQGRYVATLAFFATELDDGDLTAPADGTSPTGLGRLSQGTFEFTTTALTYPTQSLNQASYFVDSLFTQSAFTNIAATEAAAVGTADGPGLAVTVSATEATAAGTAEWDAGSAVALDLVADNPVDGVGDAYNPTVSTVPAVNPAAGEADGAGAAQNPVASAGVVAVEAVAAGTASGPTPTVGAGAGEADGAGAAQNPVASAGAVAAEAVAAGVAYSPTVSGSSFTNAGPVEAVGAGTADNPTADVTVDAGGAVGAGTAEWDAGAVVALDLVADNPVDGVGDAYNPAVFTGSDWSAAAGDADGVGVVDNPAAAVMVLAAVAAALGEATSIGGSDVLPWLSGVAVTNDLGFVTATWPSTGSRRYG